MQFEVIRDVHGHRGHQVALRVSPDHDRFSRGMDRHVAASEIVSPPPKTHAGLVNLYMQIVPKGCVERCGDGRNRARQPTRN